MYVHQLPVYANSSWVYYNEIPTYNIIYNKYRFVCCFFSEWYYAEFLIKDEGCYWIVKLASQVPPH